jgi:hypothetical protein
MNKARLHPGFDAALTCHTLEHPAGESLCYEVGTPPEPEGTEVLGRTYEE